MNLVRGQTVNVDIINLGSSGEGVAKYNEYTLFIPFTAIGDNVDVKVEHIKGNIAYANLVKVVVAGENRVGIKCRVYTKCGGCQLQHISKEAQAEFKRNLVINNLGKIGGLSDVEVLPTVVSKYHYNYRNKVQLPVGSVDGKFVVGFFRSGSHTIIPINGCALQGEWCDELIDVVTNFVRKYGVTPYNELNHSGLMRHIIGRYVDGQLLVTIVVNGISLPFANQLLLMLEAQFNKVGLYVNLNTRKSNVILGSETNYIGGLRVIESTCLDIKYQLQPLSFFQVNDFIKDEIYSAVKNLLITSETKAVFDLYSGIGILSGTLCSDNYITYGVEIVKSASEDADKLKELNNLGGKLINVCGDVDVQLPNLMERHVNDNTAVVVDPPRKGIGALAETLLKCLPSQIVYISCDSATLARDLKKLSVSYNIDKVQPYDMFPHTAHVETLVSLKRKQM